MIIFYFIVIIFLFMLLFPIIRALISFKCESTPLYIEQSNSRNPRYFALSFIKKFDEAWQSYNNSGIIKLSKDEKIIEVDKIDINSSELCESIVYSEKNNFNPSQGVIFNKEVYCNKDAVFNKIPIIRAVACKGKLVIGDNTKIIRWIDGEEGLQIYKNCNLGLSATSATQLTIGINCEFKRLYAPEILLGLKEINNINKLRQNDSEKDKLSSNIIISPDIVRNLKYVDDRNVDDSGVLNKTIITKHDITVFSNYIVNGHIRSHKDVKLDDNSIVYGNIFAEGNIFIGTNVKVLGLVFSQENIFIENNVVIGQQGKIKSVVARGNIEFGFDCKVYGYVCSGNKGKICPHLGG